MGNNLTGDELDHYLRGTGGKQGTRSPNKETTSFNQS